MAILRPVSELRILLAIDSGSTLKVHRDMDGHKDFMLHPLEGRSSPVEPDDVLALVENALLDSNKKFPAATFWMTERGRETVAALTPYERDAILKPKKSIDYQDYLQHPLWIFIDDDGDDLEPYFYGGHIEETKWGNLLFPLCEFVLADGTRRPGVIFVVIRGQRVYGLRFVDEAGLNFAFSVNLNTYPETVHSQIAAFLGKPLEAVFPLRYETPYKFADGTPLIGQIE